MNKENRGGNYLSYAILGNSLIVTHPQILPHEICHIEGQWYCYPISPELDRLKDLKFSGDWKIDAFKEIK